MKDPYLKAPEEGHLPWAPFLSLLLTRVGPTHSTHSSEPSFLAFIVLPVTLVMSNVCLPPFPWGLGPCLSFPPMEISLLHLAHGGQFLLQKWTNGFCGSQKLSTGDKPSVENISSTRHTLQSPKSESRSLLGAQFFFPQIIIWQEEHKIDRQTTHWWGLPSHLKHTRGPKTERSNDGAPPQRRFVITVPVHAVLLAPVKVAEQGVEGVASVLFNLVLQREQHGMPLQSTGQEKGQRQLTWEHGGSHRETGSAKSVML